MKKFNLIVKVTLMSLSLLLSGHPLFNRVTRLLGDNRVILMFLNSSITFDGYFKVAVKCFFIFFLLSRSIASQAQWEVGIGLVNNQHDFSPIQWNDSSFIVATHSDPCLTLFGSYELFDNSPFFGTLEVNYYRKWQNIHVIIKDETGFPLIQSRV